MPVNGQWVRNPYTTWNQVDPSLPNLAIEAMGPPPTSGTRDTFNELGMLEGCRKVAEVAAAVPDEKARERVCMMRAIIAPTVPATRAA